MCDYVPQYLFAHSSKFKSSSHLITPETSDRSYHSLVTRLPYHSVCTQTRSAIPTLLSVPPLRRSICAFAWEGVFTAGFGIWHDPLQETRNNSDGNWQPSGGYEYTDSSAMWLKCARSECLWCGFLAKHFPRMARECEDSPLLTVRIGRKPQSTPMSDQPMGEYDDLTIVLNKDAMTFRLYTSAGKANPNFLLRI